MSMQLDISEPSFSSTWLTIIFTSYSYSSFTPTTIYPKHCCWMNLLEKQRIMKTKSTWVWISSFFWSLVWLGTPQKSYNFQIWIANMTVLPVFNLLSFNLKFTLPYLLCCCLIIQWCPTLCLLPDPNCFSFPCGNEAKPYGWRALEEH